MDHRSLTAPPPQPIRPPVHLKQGLTKHPSPPHVTPEKELRDDDGNNDQTLDSNFQPSHGPSPAHAVINLLSSCNSAHQQTASSLPDLLSLTHALHTKIERTMALQRRSPALSDKHLETLSKTLEKYDAARRQLKASERANEDLRRELKEAELTLAQRDRAILEMRDKQAKTNLDLDSSSKALSKLEDERRAVEEQREAEVEWTSKLKSELAEAQDALAEERDERTGEKVRVAKRRHGLLLLLTLRSPSQPNTSTHSRSRRT